MISDGSVSPVPISCVWEHNGDDTLLYAIAFPGAFSRGENLERAALKMGREIRSYAAWRSLPEICPGEIRILLDAPCGLDIRDADSDVLLPGEGEPLTWEEYRELKETALKSAADFFALYDRIPEKDRRATPLRRTFYGQVPGTAEEMYRHTKNVNAYYFGEILVEADNEGSILECRRRGFAQLEKQPDFLANPVIDGSYGEAWTLRKVLRRFIWHDRIHAKAMYRLAVALWGSQAVPDIFCFQTP